MLPRSKFLRVFLIALPLILVALLWKAARGRPRFVATPSAVFSLALSRDGRAIAAALDDGKFVWRDGGNWHALPTTDTPTPNPSLPALQFSPDDQSLLGTNLFVTARNRSLAYAWSLKTGKAAWAEATEDYEGIDNRFVFSADGQKLALLSYDVVKVFDVAGAKTKSKVRAFPTLMRAQIMRPTDKRGRGTARRGQPFPTAIALAADGKILVIADHLGRLQFWDVATGQLTSRSTPAPQPISQQLVVSPDGRFVAACDFTGLSLWDATAQRWTRTSTSMASHDVAWMPDSKSLWLGTHSALRLDNGKVRQLSVPALETLRTLPTSGPVAVAGDGRTLATRADTTEKGVWLWNIN